MIPSSRGPSELRTYLAREWNADTAFLFREEKNRKAKEESKPKKIRARRSRHFLSGLRHLITRRARAHR
jgi:hypothetical protein